MSFENVFVLLFAIASAVAVLARRLRVPYPIALVLTGVALGATRLLQPPHLTRELLYAVFLPGLVFEAAFHLEARTVAQMKGTVLVLAVPGVLASMFITGGLLALVGQPIGPGALTAAGAFLFAALIAATDPITVVALFKTLGAPHRLSVTVEAESLLNDGTAVLVFTIVLGMVTAGHVSLLHGVVAFCGAVLVGALIGVGFGVAVSRAMSFIDDPMVEITLTTIAAYGSFAVAEQLHYSGIIATLVAGMVCGNYGAPRFMSPTTRVAVESFWSYVAFALNSIVFLLLGFEVRGHAVLAAWKLILVAYFAVVIGRVVIVYLTTGLFRRSREAMPWSWSAVLTWGGMRGALSMVLAFSIGRTVDGGETIVAITFGVVTLSIVVQGLTAAPLLRRLGLTRRHSARADYERGVALLRGANAALTSLEQAAPEASADVVDELRQHYRQQVGEAQQVLQQAREAADVLRREEKLATERRLLIAEKDAALASFHEGVIAEEVLREVLADINRRLLDVEAEDDSEQ